MDFQFVKQDIMRRKDYLAKNAPKQRILKAEYLPFVKKAWRDNGYDPDMYLDEDEDFYNVLESFMVSKKNLKYGTYTYRYEEAAWKTKEDFNKYKAALEFAKENFCGFYLVDEKRYVRPEEIPAYADFYFKCAYTRQDDAELKQKLDAFLDAIAAHFIAMDVIGYQESKGLRNARITKKNLDKFLQYGAFAGQIYDTEQRRYRAPINFDEYTYHLHTDYWFHEPSKGYRRDTRYKWNPNIPHKL